MRRRPVAGGLNLPAGMRRSRVNVHHGPHPSDRTFRGGSATRFRAAPHCTMRSARTIAPSGSSKRWRSRSAVIANGMLPNTRNDSPGSGHDRASPSTTRTAGSNANEDLSPRASRGSSSIAMTLRARPASAAVSAPPPAPISTIRSSRSTCACRTSSAASRRGRKCCPRAGASDRGARGSRASTEHHHEESHVGHSISSSGAECTAEPR